MARLLGDGDPWRKLVCLLAPEFDGRSLAVNRLFHSPAPNCEGPGATRRLA